MDLFLGDATMDGPGEYLPDVTEGATCVEDLPKPKQTQRLRSHKKAPCPRCGRKCYRDNISTRLLHDLGDLTANQPIDLLVTFSQHHCSKCRKYFNVDLTDLADPGARYTRRVVHLAVRLVVEDGLPYRAASWHLWRDHRVFVPWGTIQNWIEAGGKKSGAARRPRLSG
jgi:transposase-like protein